MPHPSKHLPLLVCFTDDGLLEAGCDEAGRGALAGSVFAAAVILNPQHPIKGLQDSKCLSTRERYALRVEIEEYALAYAVGSVSVSEIDQINILNASFLAMHRALDQLPLSPNRLLVDGNQFTPYGSTPFHCIVKGDSLYQSIAAASILAKTYRDDYMLALHSEYPHYGWAENKGYPTKKHFAAIAEYGITPHHRRSFAKLGERAKRENPLL